MLFDILKLFGLDVRAKIVEAGTEFEQRMELAKSRVARTLTTASVAAALFFMAALAGLAAIGVGLSALYSWVSIYQGQFYGYAVVGGVLIIICATLSAIGFLEARYWSAEPAGPQSEPAGPQLEPPEPLVAAPMPPTAPLLSSKQDNSTSEALGLFLSKSIRLAITGSPVIDDVIENLRGPAQKVLEDAIKSTADMIRYGEREKLIGALGTAVLVGWLLERARSRQAAED